MTFRQPENDTESDTSMRIHLYKTQQVNPQSEYVYWFLYPNPNRDQHRTTMTSECRLPLPFPPSLSQLYTISRRFGRLQVGSFKYDAVSTSIETSTPLSGVRTIIGDILVLARGNGEIVSCAYIREVQSKQAVASIFNDGIKGNQRTRERERERDRERERGHKFSLSNLDLVFF